MLLADRRTLLLVVLTGFFVTNALTAEVVGVKLVDVGAAFAPGTFIMSVGVIPWPLVFLTTDLLNEFYGVRVVRRISVLTAALIAYAFVIMLIAIQVPAFEVPGGVDDPTFARVFGQSMWIIVGSITAFLIAQIVDVTVFWWVRERTGARMIWARATGSTVVSQLIDTVVVIGIAFWLPGRLTTTQFLGAVTTSYSSKLVIAVALTPLIYLGHWLVERYLGTREAGTSVRQSAEESLHHQVQA
jgi:queuosine precursor transporter